MRTKITLIFWVCILVGCAKNADIESVNVPVEPAFQTVLPKISKDISTLSADDAFKVANFNVDRKNLIIDASHNPNGIRALRENLDYYYPNQKRRFIFGCLKNKDYESMMNILFEDGDEVYLNEFDYPTACTFEELKKACPVKSEKYNGQKLTTDKLNIICGSFYMLKDLLNRI